MLYMIVERYKNKDARPVYRRFHERGRMMPPDLAYISSWVDHRLEICFQLVETENNASIDDWISHWQDLVDFEIYPVMSSQDAAAMVNEQPA